MTIIPTWTSRPTRTVVTEEVVTSNVVTEKSESPYTTTVIIDGHSVVESKLTTVTVTPSSPVTFTETETVTTFHDGHEETETITTTDTFTPTIYSSVETDYHTYRTNVDGKWETKTTTKTVTDEIFTTTEIVDGQTETFTVTSSVTTVDTAPVTVTSIDTYKTMSHGQEVTKSTTHTDYYSNASELPCEDRHLRKDSAWEPTPSITPVVIDTWYPEDSF